MTKLKILSAAIVSVLFAITAQASEGSLRLIYGSSISGEILPCG